MTKQIRDQETTAPRPEDQKYSIMEWERIRLPVGLAYTVIDTQSRLAVLIVCDRGADQPGQPSLRVQTIDTSRYGSPSAIYMDEAVVLPLELQKTISRRRLRWKASNIRDRLMECLYVPSNPELFMYESCCVLERGFNAEEMLCLLEHMKDYGDDLGFDVIEYDSLRVLYEECSKLWPELIGAN